MWKWINRGLLILIVMLVILWWQWPRQRLEIDFCKVGQGDATLVSWGKYQMLVDGGPDNSVLSCLGENMAFWDRKIELVVLTHPESDHVTGLIEVIKRYKVERLIRSDVDNDTAEFREFMTVIGEKQIKVSKLSAGSKFKMGLVNFKVLHPFNKGQSFVKDLNEESIVLLGDYGNPASAGKFTFLLTGDIGEKTEDVLRLTNKLEPVDVLKVGHHGSKFSSSAKFLEVVKPKLAVIEVGKNRFGHPSEEVLERLRKGGARIMRTDEDGAVKVISDGKNWWIK
jgi:competence protein ComEC